MNFHVAILYKTFTTGRTDVGTLSCVGLHVPTKKFGRPKSRSTYFTIKWLFSSVHPLMICSVIVNCKRLGASLKRTFERSLLGVNQLEVNLAVVLVFKRLSTFIANKRPFITVCFFVPFQCILGWELGITFITRVV